MSDPKQPYSNDRRFRERDGVFDDYTGPNMGELPRQGSQQDRSNG